MRLESELLSSPRSTSLSKLPSIRFETSKLEKLFGCASIALGEHDSRSSVHGFEVVPIDTHLNYAITLIFINNYKLKLYEEEQ
jgi:hypothetical protein